MKLDLLISFIGGMYYTNCNKTKLSLHSHAKRKFKVKSNLFFFRRWHDLGVDDVDQTTNR